MIHLVLTIAFLIIVSLPQLVASEPDFDSAPWLRARSIENYKSLLSRSPFSLPTAEETTEMADRFILTGAATINEKPVVFVFDKNTQNRLMLGQLDGQESKSSDRLLELFASEDPKNLRASILIEGKQTEIRFSEMSFAQAQPPPAQQAPPGTPPIPPNPAQLHPGAPQKQTASQTLNPQPTSAIPGNNSDSQTPRRVIRRRVISGQPPAAQPIPGQ